MANENWRKEKEELNLSARKDSPNLAELARLEQIIEAIVTIAMYLHQLLSLHKGLEGDVLLTAVLSHKTLAERVIE